MEIVNVTSKTELDFLYENSALTLEGLDPKAVQDFTTWAEERGMDKVTKVYLIPGKLMNESYGLTGKNAYPKDLTIASIVGESTPKIAIDRFNVGARWFNDIVNINKENQTQNA